MTLQKCAESYLVHKMPAYCARAVDPYISGSNSVDKEVAENPDLDQIAADAQAEQKSANLVASASTTRFETLSFIIIFFKNIL